MILCNACATRPAVGSALSPKGLVWALDGFGRFLPNHVYCENCAPFLLDSARIASLDEAKEKMKGEARNSFQAMLRSNVAKFVGSDVLKEIFDDELAKVVVDEVQNS